MTIYVRCPNTACRKDLPTKTKVCPKCGTSIPRTNKTYKVVVKYRGKRYVKIVPNSLEVARNIETKIKTELVSGEYYDRKKLAKQNIKYEDFIREKYLPYAKDNKKSWSREEFLLRLWILPVIGSKPLSSVSPFDIERIKKNMRDANRAPRTIEYALAVIRHTFNKAIDWGFFSGVNPTTRVKKPKPNNKRVRFLSPEEAEKLLTELKKHSQQIYEMALLSLHTGMRAGEIFNLKFGDLDLTNGIIYIRNSKSGEDRVAYMTKEVKEILSKKEGKPDEYVFKDTKGEKIGRISNTFMRVVNKLGLNKDITDDKDKVVFHTLRHTFASWLVMNGTPIYTVKELMGHKTLAMTERYSHLAPDTKKEAIKGIENTFKEKKNILPFTRDMVKVLS